MLKKILLTTAAVVVLIALGAVLWIGPSNLIGSLTHGRQVRDGDLEFGDSAPEVTVIGLDGVTESPLSDVFGMRPVVLVFASYTSPDFRRTVPRLESVASQFEDRVRFLTIYIKEAHAEDEWQVKANREMDIYYSQPVTLGERLRIARDFVDHFGFNIPLVVDGIENAAEEAYAAWPLRIYVVDEASRIVYKSRAGEDGFDLVELAQWLDASLPEVLGPLDQPGVDAPPPQEAPI